MTLHRSTSPRVRRSIATLSMVAGPLFTAHRAGAAPSPQPERVDPVVEAAASRTSVGGADRGGDRWGDNDGWGARGDRVLFTWTGRVDREVLIVVRGRDVSTRGFDASLPNRARVRSALPRTNANVIAELNDGRGDVDVIEQPSARNGYSAVLRVRDPRGGADNYRLTAYIDDRFGRDDIFDRRGRNDDRDDDRNRDRNRGNDRNGDWGRDNGRNDRSIGSLDWNGRVDDVVEIRISGRRVDAITRSGNTVSDVYANIRGGGLPNRSVNLQIDQRAGRGSVAVIQQPGAWNGFTAIIRINDSRAGAAYYDFTAYWE